MSKTIPNLKVMATPLNKKLRAILKDYGWLTLPELARLTDATLEDVGATLDRMRDLPRQFTVAEAAARLDRSVAWVQRIARDNEIGLVLSTSGSGRRVFSHRDLDALSKYVIEGETRGRKRKTG